MSKNSNISSTPAGKNSSGGNFVYTLSQIPDWLLGVDKAIALALIESGFEFVRSTSDLSEDSSTDRGRS